MFEQSDDTVKAKISSQVSQSSYSSSSSWNPPASFLTSVAFLLAGFSAVMALDGSWTGVFYSFITEGFRYLSADLVEAAAAGDFKGLYGGFSLISFTLSCY